MARAARLFDLLQALRRHRRPVTAAALAEETGVSARTLYRDIATLQALGAPIEGEAGLGYVLKPGFLLPPLMLGAEELEAVMLGLAWVAASEEADLARAAEDAMAKVEAVLPPERAAQLDVPALAVAKGAPASPHLAPIRAALTEGRKLRIAYVDKRERATERVVWPVLLGFMEGVLMLAAWDELRGDFRHFRLDRMQSLDRLEARLPKSRARLLAEWKVKEGMGGT
jgi:predicted DNA-binding transcriptional regulator YafY